MRRFQISFQTCSCASARFAAASGEFRKLVIHTSLLAGGATAAFGGPPVVAIVVGVVAWAVFGFWLHGPLIGVRPFG